MGYRLNSKFLILRDIIKLGRDELRKTINVKMNVIIKEIT